MFIATLIVKLQPPQLRAFPASPAALSPSVARARKPRFPAAAYHVPAHRLGVDLTVSPHFRTFCAWWEGFGFSTTLVSPQSRQSSRYARA